MLGYLKTEKLVELDAGNNAFDRKSETDILLLSLSLLSSKDILSTVVELPNRIEIQNASEENKSLSEGADWLNKHASSKLTANMKPGMGKHKRDKSNESELINSTKKQRGGRPFQ